MCQCKTKCSCQDKKLDLSKPVQVRCRDGSTHTARVVCTDSHMVTGCPIMVLYSREYGGFENLVLFTQDGTGNINCTLENVPPKPASKTKTVYLVRRRANGDVALWSSWQEHFSRNWELLGNKVVTVTEGEWL